MKQVSIAALALALAIGGVAATPVLAKDKKAEEAKPVPPKPSPAIIKAAPVIDAAYKAKDFATMKATALPLVPEIKNDDDKLFVGQWLAQSGQATQDEAVTNQGVDLMLASGKTPAALLPQLLVMQGQTAFQKKDYARATASLQQAIAAGTTTDVYPMLIESMRGAGQRPQALTLLTEIARKKIAANEPVPAEWYQRGFSIAYGAKPAEPDYAAVRAAGIELSKLWATSEAKGSVWHDVVLLYRESVQEDAELKLDINRFLLASKGLVSGADYLEYAETAYLRYPGEAKSVLDAGVAAGKLNFTSNKNAQEINQIVTGKIPADKASLAASEKSARAGGTVAGALATANAFYGYGDYAKAAELYTIAGTKGADANLVNMRIGEAQFRAGDKAAAKASFAKVTGPRKHLADFWVILADHPTA